jgi:hypothetical protein
MTRTFKISALVLGAVLIGAMPAMAANELLVTSAAALPGSVAQPGVTCSGDGLPGPCGLEVVIDGASNTNDVYVVSSHPNAETTYNFSFYIYPGNLTMPPTGEFVIGNIRKTEAPARNFFFVYLRKTGNGLYWTIQTNAREDNGSFQPWQAPVKICGDNSTPIPCGTVGPQEFRFEWTASDPGMSNGSLKIYKNGSLKKEFLNMDNDGQTIDESWFGAVWMSNGTQGNSNGSYYFDTFTSTR